jgi:hypothetical protein
MARRRYTGANRSADTLQVTGVLVDPSAAAWVCIITQTDGTIVFSAKGAGATSEYFPIQDTWGPGVNITTATNLTAVYIYS